MEVDVHELSVGGLLIDGGVLLLKGPIIITTKSLQIMNSGAIICDFLYFSTYNNCTTESPCVDLSLRADYLNLTSGGNINCSALSVNATSVYVEFNTSISSNGRGFSASSRLFEGYTSDGLSGGSHGGIGGTGSPKVPINTSSYDFIDNPIFPGDGLLSSGGGVIRIAAEILIIG